MSVVTIYDGEYGILTLERIKGRQVIIRTTDDSAIPLPLLKCPCPELFSIFGMHFNKVHSRAVRLDWEDTKCVIEKLLDETAYRKSFKPSSILHYTVQLAPSQDMSSVSMNFTPYYSIWRKVTQDDGQFTFEEEVTDPITYKFVLTAEEYFEALCYISIHDGDTAKTLWKEAINANFIMPSDWDFGDMDVEILEAIYDDFDFGEG